MNQEIREFVKKQSEALANAGTACAEVKAAANAWLSAAGTEAEAEETKKYLAELEEDIIPIDGLITFAESAQGAAVFGGEEAAKGVAAHGREIKAKGARYCDCPACAACEAILGVKDQLL